VGATSPRHFAPANASACAQSQLLSAVCAEKSLLRVAAPDLQRAMNPLDEFLRNEQGKPTQVSDRLN